MNKEKRPLKIALSGNPNAGKTTIFNAITGSHQHIANYPGVTVEKKYGRIRHRDRDLEIVDLPGIYSLTAYSIEEIVARDYLVNEKPDVVIDIVDASNLDRHLYLALQFKELGVPLVIALNMVDVASSRGISVDETLLAKLFDAPVVPTVARSQKGLDDLLDRALEVAWEDHDWGPQLISYGQDIDEALWEIESVLQKDGAGLEKYALKWLALKCVEGDEQILALVEKFPRLTGEITNIRERVEGHIRSTLEDEPEGIIADHRYGHIAGITRKTTKRKIESRINLTDILDRVLTNRILGPLIMMGILYGIYEFTFWASDTPVIWVEAFFGWLKEMVSLALPPGNLRSLLVSGVIDGVGGVLGFVPLIMFMFFSIAFMEDVGYMARVAYMLDRVLRWFGLHGNSVMALLISGGISGGCAVPGVMATRTLRDPKERIATLLVVPFMNCGAKLPLFGLLIAAFFSNNEARMLFIFTLLSWAFALFAAKLIRATLLRGPKTPFVMELPPYRLPTLKGLLIHTWERTWQYIKKAGTVILAFSVVLWGMMTFPKLPAERTGEYMEMRSRAAGAFLASSDLAPPDLEILDRTYGAYGKGLEAGGPDSVPPEGPPYLALARTAHALGSGDPLEGDMDPGMLESANAYLEYRERLRTIRGQEQQAALRYAVAGRIGEALETVTRLIGFDYRINIALVGGFAAKEIIVSTLGTAYSLGETDPEQSDTLSKRFQQSPDWSPLKAFTLILFTMLYVPCFVTLVMIRKESSWKWAGFSIVFNLLVAYTVSLVVFQVGRSLGIGV